MGAFQPFHPALKGLDVISKGLEGIGTKRKACLLSADIRFGSSRLDQYIQKRSQLPQLSRVCNGSVEVHHACIHSAEME